MHKFPLKIAAISCGLALAGGCTFLDRASQPKSAVVPVSDVTHSPAVRDPDYQIGRSHQARLEYDAAIAAYRKSLEANPGNAEAHNALGVIYASQGKHELAVTELKAAAALASRAAHIHSNLGYAYLLAGRDSEALAALNVAAGLDPANERARENLIIVQKRLGLDAVASPSRELPSRVTAEPTAPSTDQAGVHSGGRLVNVAPHIYELRRESAPQAKARSPLATETAPATLRLEVANGNGVSGLARRTMSYLQRKGYATARLTNQAPYTQVTTVIQYRHGHENQAKRLNALLPAPVGLVEFNQLRKDVGVRLVLGRDTAERPLFAETEIRTLVASR